MIYKYDGFGLKISSDISFPELQQLPEASGIDCNILLSREPNVVDTPITESVDFSVNRVEAVLKGEGFDLSIKGGHQIIIHDKGIGDNWELVRLRVLGAGIGVLLQQRGMFVLHGATIVGQKGAVVLLGNSGDGKSTLTAQLVEYGYSSMGDDKSVISANELSPLAIPSIPYIKLSKRSVDKFGLSDQEHRTISRSHDKLYVSLGDKFYSNPVAVKGFFVLSRENDMGLDELSVEHAFASLMEHSYRRKKLYGIGVHKKHFLECHQLAQAFPMFKYHRLLKEGVLQDPSTQFLEKIEALIGHE
jgi:hypothetical protein